MDKWNDVICPKCGMKKVHAWYFDYDCRGNPSSQGTEACKACGYKPNKKESEDCVKQLWK